MSLSYDQPHLGDKTKNGVGVIGDSNALLLLFNVTSYNHFIKTISFFFAEKKTKSLFNLTNNRKLLS